MSFCCPTSSSVQRCRLAAAVTTALLLIAGAAPNAEAAASVEFNPQFLQGEQAGKLDLSRFERGDELPGTYSADIRVNGVVVARRDVELRAMDGGGVVACLSPAVMEVLGVDPARLPAAGDMHDANGQPMQLQPMPATVFCDDIGHYIPQATARFDAGEQVMDISIPQAYLSRDPRGWVNPELWDDGITAGLLGYSVSHQQLQGRGFRAQSSSAMLNAGLNLGAWRLRHDGYLSHSSGSGTDYRAGRTYAQRSIAAWGMQLTAGEASTRGDLFDPVSYRGVSIGTDPRMLPDSQRDYAPTVRGVAQTNAKVLIRQRDHVLYQTNVAAGPFEINDLYGTAYAGDLEVEVIENDGRVQRFVVPFAAVPQLLRAGQQRISATLATLRDQTLRDAPTFVEASLRRGLGNRVTGFAGTTGAEGYAAVLLGGAVNTAVGAFSGDVTVARARLPGGLTPFGQSTQGQSWRLAYSKDMAATGTHLAMAAYRYATDGYLSLNDAMRLRQWSGQGAGGVVGRQRSRIDINVNQRLGEGGGALYASGSSVDYWDVSQRRTNFAIGYSGGFGPARYSLSAQRSLERDRAGGSAREGNSINFSLSVPLSSRVAAPRLTAALNRRSDGSDDLRAGVAGSFGERRQGSYSASASHDGQRSTTYDAGINYQAPSANVNAGYSGGAGNRALSLGASGGVVLHRAGAVFAPSLGETVAIVEVPDAAGARMESAVGVKTNADGYALVPYLTPFRRNQVMVDPRGLPMDVELKTASVTGVPTAGAVVHLLIPTSSGRSALIEAPQTNGRPLPFGTDVYNEAGDVVGVVGQASRLWVRGIEERGRLTVRLGSEAGAQCVVDYALDGVTPGALVPAQCAASTPAAQ